MMILNLTSHRAKAIVEVWEKGGKIIPLLGREICHFLETNCMSFIILFGFLTKYGLSLPPTLLNEKSRLQAFEFLNNVMGIMQRDKT